MSDWKQHPLSAAYPAMSNEEFEGFKADLLENGLKESVVMFEGMVLDGWHRVQACQGTVEIRTREYQGKDPGGYVISKNGHRRNLTASQRAAAALRVREIQPAGNPNFAPPSKTENPNKNAESDKITPGVKLGVVAKEAGVSQSTMSDANVAKEGGLLDQVVDGTKSAKQAAKEVRQQKNPKPKKEKKPTPLEKARAEIVELRVELADRDEKIQEVTDLLKSYLDAGDDDNEQQVKFAQLREQIRVLGSQLNEHKMIANQFKRECKALQKELKTA